jgi:hypothetical protein
MPEGADQATQAIKAQELFNETLIRSPIAHAGDHYKIQLTRPKLYPITIIYKGEPTKMWCDSTAIKVISEEARRVFGNKFNVSRKIDQPGLVYEDQVKRTSKNPEPKDTTKTRRIGRIPISSPSVAHMRSAGPQPLDHRPAAVGASILTGPDSDSNGIQLIILFPELNHTLQRVELAESATREEMMELITRQKKLPKIHEDYIECAPLDWFAKRRLTVRYQVNRRDLSTLEVVPHDEFLRRFDPTIPVWIETDGACSGNPGPEGWGYIMHQGDVVVEAFGPDPDTSNNEMELQAILEALGALPSSFQGYVVLESDSEGCLKTMMGSGRV